MKNYNKFDYPLLTVSYRVFFALAGLWALLMFILWVSIFDGSLVLKNYFKDEFWHVHEMLFGYSGAVIAGFLLTEAKTWTGVNTIKSSQLLFLSLFWLYGRCVPFYSGLIPDPFIALVDFLFLPLVLYFVCRSMMLSGRYEKSIFLVLLFLMCCGNILIHADMLGWTQQTAWFGLIFVFSVFVIHNLITIGLVLPTATEKGLKSVIAIRNRSLDLVCVVLASIALILFTLNVSGVTLALSAVLAMLSNSYRVYVWFDNRVWYVPLLWILYVGYGWIILGFALLIMFAFSFVSATEPLHAFGLGGAILSLGMMARMPLTRIGKPLRAARVIEIAFVLLNLAAVFRVLLPPLLPNWFDKVIVVASYSWLAAFALFVYYYLPLLSQAQIGQVEE